MNLGLSETTLVQLSQCLAEQIGLHFPREKWPDLERGVRSMARELGCADLESFVYSLVSRPLTLSQIGLLAGNLAVGETYFFREAKTFQALEESILPELLGSRRGGEQRLRLWSAGCCTGEEPYSLAILLNRLIPDLHNWNITILGTDLNPRFLRTASHGVYGGWSFRSTPQWISDRYFTQTLDRRLAIRPELKMMVQLACLNLAEDVYPSVLNNTNAMDVIVCRNVLMYFTPERARKVVQSFCRCLVEGGWLLVSPSETSTLLDSSFVAVNFPDAILYRKDPGHRQTVRIPPRLTAEEVGSRVNPLAAPVVEPVLQDEDREGTSEGPAGEEAAIAVPSAPTLYEGGAELFERGDYAKCAEILREHISLCADDSRALALLARACANQGCLAEALHWCNAALTFDRLDPACHYLRGAILQEQGANDEAVAALKRTLYLDPKFVLAHVALASLTRRLGKLQESEKHFQNALSILNMYLPEERLTGADGMTAGRLVEFMASTTGMA